MNNIIESLSQNDIIQLKDCISFVLDKDEDLDQEGVNELWNINMKLVSLMEANKVWLIQTMSPRIEVARL